MTWFKIDRDNDRARLHIGDGIGFEEPGCSDINALLADLDGATVNLTINSSGGCGRTAETLFLALHGRTPEAVILGECASSAALIALAAGRIVIHPAGRMMLHAPSACTFATASQMREQADYLERLTAGWIDRLCDRTGAPLATVCSWLNGPDVWFSANEAVAIGLADAILEMAPARKKPREIATEIPNAPSTEAEAHIEEALLLDLLRALGTVKTTNKKKLFKNLSAWFTTNIQEISP